MRPSAGVVHGTAASAGRHDSYALTSMSPSLMSTLCPGLHQQHVTVEAVTTCERTSGALQCTGVSMARHGKVILNLPLVDAKLGSPGHHILVCTTTQQTVLTLEARSSSRPSVAMTAL